MSDESQLPPGTILRDRYVIQHTISHGGFGNVYLATDRQFKREVAIKEAFFSDDETRKQFALEAEVLIHLTHPNIVRGFASFEHSGRFYLVMQYITGQNLEEMQIEHFKAHHGPMPETQVLRLIAAVCDAAQALHEGHVLHRDIKPANIKVNDSGQPILLDLGLAKLFNAPDSRTLIAAQAYTPGYAPLEQCEDGGSTTVQTDIYALGATIFYSLTGRQPWESLKRMRELYSGQQDMPPPSRYVSHISPATDAIVRCAMDLKPDQRYVSARAMRAAILQALSALEDRGASTPSATAMPAPSATMASPAPASPPTQDVAALPTNNLGQTPLPGPVKAPEQALIPTRELPPLPSKPEPPQPRIVVNARPSPLAGVVVFLGALSLCPGLGVLLWLVTLPMGIIAMNRIGRSRGLYKGRGRALLGIFLSLAGLVEIPVILYFVTNPLALFHH